MTPYEIPEDFFAIKIELNHSEFELNLKDILATPITETTDVLELEELLGQVTGYLHLLLTAHNRVTADKNKIETEFEIWYNEKYINTEDELRNSFLSEVEAGVRSKTNSIPTKNQIESKITCIYTEDYINYKRVISNYERKLEFLSKEYKIIETRGSHIQSMLSMRKSLLEHSILGD